MDGLAARWEAADGLGPLPGTHAFERAEARDDAPSAAGALHVAGRSVSVREERFSAGETGAMACLPRHAASGPGGTWRGKHAMAPDGRASALKVTLDDLEKSGRPIPVLLPGERERLEQLADTDRGDFERTLTDVKARARAEAARLRLLFDLERLEAHLPAGLAEELTVAAGGVDPGPESAAAIRALRERLLDGLARRGAG